MYPGRIQNLRPYLIHIVLVSVFVFNTGKVASMESGCNTEHYKSDFISIFLFYFHFVLQDMILQYITGKHLKFLPDFINR